MNVLTNVVVNFFDCRFLQQSMSHLKSWDFQRMITTKCMNPIIFIDELDKVSNTEHGREIIGILTHLIDPTQNTGFNDKYFSGIDIDLSLTSSHVAMVIGPVAIVCFLFRSLSMC